MATKTYYVPLKFNEKLRFMRSNILSLWFCFEHSHRTYHFNGKYCVEFNDSNFVILMETKWPLSNGFYAPKISFRIFIKIYGAHEMNTELLSWLKGYQHCLPDIYWVYFETMFSFYTIFAYISAHIQHTNFIIWFIGFNAADCIQLL